MQKCKTKEFKLKGIVKAHCFMGLSFCCKMAECVFKLLKHKKKTISQCNFLFGKNYFTKNKYTAGTDINATGNESE